MRKQLTLLILLIAPVAARADLDTDCPEPAEFEEHILMCGQNEVVAQQAAWCAQAVGDSWNSATARLLPSLQALGKAHGQSASEAESKLGYLNALHEIEGQIGVMQKYTSRLEQYAQIMIDVPGSTGDDDSLDCFNSAFHQLQETIDYLDSEIVRAKETYESTADMMELSGARKTAMADSITTKLTKGARPAAAKAPVGGESENSPSTVTGKIEQDRLDSLAAAENLKSRYPASEAQFLNGKPVSEAAARNSIELGKVAGTRENRDLENAKVTEAVAASTFADKLDQRKVSTGATSSQAGKSAGRASVGAVLWQNAGPAGGRTQLSLRATAVTGAEANGSSNISTGDSTPFENGSAFETGFVSSAASVAGAEQDLFSLVRLRYRATEQFRSSEPAR